MAAQAQFYIVNFGPKQDDFPSYVQVAAIGFDPDEAVDSTDSFTVQLVSNALPDVRRVDLATFKSLIDLYPAGLYTKVTKFLSDAQKTTNRSVIARTLKWKLTSAAEIRESLEIQPA